MSMNLNELIDELTQIRDHLKEKNIPGDHVAINIRYETDCAWDDEAVKRENIEVEHHDWDPEKPVNLYIEGTRWYVED